MIPTPYKLNQLVSRPKGTEVILPKIEERLSTIASYQAELNKLLRAIAKEVNNDIIPRYRSELSLQNAERRAVGDSPDRSWFQRLRDLTRQLTTITDATVERILGLEAERHTSTFIASVRRVLGINVSAVVRDEQLDDYLKLAAARNASLITGLTDDTIKKIEQTVLTNFAQGNSVKTLKKALTEQFGMSQNRANLIAFDQTAKLNSDLNKIRQQQAGINEYDWSTSHNERVRPLHRSLDGKRYKYDEPTGAEGGLPPGQPIRCHCIALGVIHF